MSKESELLKSDYLWDGSGEPDAEILRLEQALGKFRHAGRAPDWPEDSRQGPDSPLPNRGQPAVEEN